MLRQRVFLALALALALILLVTALSVAQDLICTHCRKSVNQGVRINGKFFCKPHMDHGLAKCHCCRKPIRTNYVAVGPKSLPICMDCRNTLPECFLCGLPCETSKGAKSLSDGRHVCASDAKHGVVSAQRAQEIFTLAVSQLQTTFAGKLAIKTPIQEVSLVDLSEMKRVVGETRIHSPGQTHLGVATIVQVTQGPKRWLEPSTVHLLNFVPDERMVSVCAHEYAHLWQAENHAKFTETTAILREGFAEWVAYKVAAHFKRKDTMTLLKNPNGGIYYQGLRKFLELEKKAGIDGVLKYARSATTI